MKIANSGTTTCPWAAIKRRHRPDLWPLGALQRAPTAERSVIRGRIIIKLMKEE